MLFPVFNLNVREADGTPSVDGVRGILVTNGTLTDNGDGTVTIATGGGGSGGDLLSELTAAEIAVEGSTTATVGRMHVCSGTSLDYTVTLPAASGNAGKLIGFRMSPALTRLVTLDGNGSETIDGATTRVMWAEESAILLCDGSNWFKIAGKSIPMACRMRQTVNQSIPNNSITVVTLNAADFDNTGFMANTGSNRIDIIRSGTYQCVAGARMGSFSAVASRAEGMAQVNTGSTQYAFTEFYAPVGGYPFVQGTDRLVLSDGDYVRLRAYQNSGASQSTFGDVSSQASSLAIQEIPQW